MKKNTFVALISLLIGFSACGQSAQVQMLEGKWQVENKQTFEVWTKSKTALYTGQSYKIKEGKRNVSETLKIEKKGKSIVYTALVPSQNDGAAIPFTLNTEERELLSFENPTHDFPVKIQYKSISKDRLFVNVLGADGNGFSYYMNRVKD